MSHRIELALKDSLDDAMQPIKKSLTALFYCYEKSSKKLRELHKLHKVLLELYEFEDGRVKPSKCSGTRWIAHVLRSMSGLIDKFGLYLQHFETIISDTTKKTDKATLEGKSKKLTDASILLRSALFIDLLEPAKKFSILSQREDFNIIDMVDRLDDMLLLYQIRKRNIDNDPDIVYSFPTVEKLLKNIKITTSENGTLAYQYQDVKIDYFRREKTNLSKNAASFIDQILDAVNNRFEGITSEEANVEGMPTAGDLVLRDVCTVLDTQKWTLPKSMAINEANLTCLFEKNVEALKCVFLHFGDILVKTFPGINVLSVEEEFILVVSHVIKHFNTQVHPPLALWQYLYGIRESKSWLNIFGVIEICICAPCSNATLERFFSQLRVVKSVWHNRLSEENLTHLLLIKVTGPSREIFHNDYCNITVGKWYNDKNRRLGQNKRKKYRKRKRNKKQRSEFDLPLLLETSSESEESDNNI